MLNKKKIVAIVGPTASGKSDLANELACKIEGEVVSADSMQIYECMDIGTGKIPKKEQKVKHWCLNICKPNQAFSAALYQKYSRDCFDKIFKNNKTPVLCGGTGFYIRAAIDDYDFPKGEQVNNSIRDKYIKYSKEHGRKALWELLKKHDNDSAIAIHPNNEIRVIRALELLEEGKSYAKQLENLQNIKQIYDVNLFGLKVDVDILRQRIDERVDKMFDNGLVDEVKNLLDKGYRDAITAASAIGYKEIVRYFDNKYSLDEAKEQIKLATKRYAKRQRTWFNKDKRIKWIEYNNADIKTAINYIIESIFE